MIKEPRNSAEKYIKLSKGLISYSITLLNKCTSIVENTWMILIKSS